MVGGYAARVVGLVAVSAVIVCTSVSAAPQEPQPEPPPDLDLSATRVHLGIWGLVGTPVGDFGDNLGTHGGIGGDFDVRLGDTPVRVGVAVSGLFQGSATRQVPFSTTIPDVLVDVRTSANMVLTHGRVRFQPTADRVRPWVEGLVGFSYLFTRTSIDLGSDESIGTFDPGTTNQSDVALSVGGGGGVSVGLYAGAEAVMNLDVGVQYLYGGEAEYLVGGPEGFDLGLEGLEFRRSRTDLVQVQIGISVDF